MKKILFIAYYYPPLGGGGVQRTVYFVKYLPEYDFYPMILTGPDVQTSVNFWEVADTTLVGKIGEHNHVYRVSNQPPGHESAIERRIRRILSLPDAFSSWWIEHATKKGEQILQQENVDLIFATVSPYASASIAAYLSKKSGIPWVADLRDPWALDEVEEFPTIIHKMAGLRQMHKVLKTASAVIMNTPEAEKRLKMVFPIFNRKKTVAITNGYDPADFAGVAERTSTTKFRIVHSGYFYTELGLILQKKKAIHRILGGISPRVNLFTRSPYFLIKALENWVGMHPDVLDKIEVLFLGKMSESDLQLIHQSNIASRMIRTVGYVTHSENIRYLRSADLLFLAMHDLSNGDRATTVYGKTYEYMGSKAPILAAVPEGDAKDFLRACGTAFFCKPDDWLGMTDIMMHIFKLRQMGLSAVSPNKFIEQFDRKVLTGKLAAVFHEIVN